MEKDGSKIDMDALDAITDRVLTYGPPKPRKKRLRDGAILSPPDRLPKGKRAISSSKNQGQGKDSEES